MNKKAFTLIELLVVVLIIGILAAIAVPQYQKAVNKTRLTRVINMLKAIKDAQEVYYLANGHYATNFDDLDVSLPNGDLQTSTSSWWRYKNGDTYFMHIVNEIPQSIKVAPGDFSGKLQFELFLDHSSLGPIIQCAGTDDRSKNVCKSMGGIQLEGYENYFRF